MVIEMDVKDEIIKAIGNAISEMNAIEREKNNPVPEIPKDYTKTEKIIASMLYENTGAHILDSGDYYGRHWERNRKIKDFRKLPKLTVDFYEGTYDYIEITYNTFHYLVAHLERDKKSEYLEKKLYEFAESDEYEYTPWLPIMEDFAKELEKEGWEIITTFNTYNWENLLSQVLQGIIIEDKDREDYLILQIHNGCDVRGGYTDPRIFHIPDGYDSFLIDMDDAYAACECTSIYTDDAGAHWYNDNGDEGIPEYWEIDKENNKLICKKCGKEVIFSPSF